MICVGNLSRTLSQSQRNGIWALLASLQGWTVELSCVAASYRCELAFNEPYLTRQTSPTTISATGTCTICAARSVEKRCSSSILLWSPRNCLSFCQSLNDVTSTTTMTADRIAAPSIHPAFESTSSVDPKLSVPTIRKVNVESFSSHKANRATLISVFPVRHQFALGDYEYGASASRGVPV